VEEISVAMKHLLLAMIPLSEPEVLLALALLALLILGTRGKSLLAHGAFAGLFLGYLASEWERRSGLGWSYFHRLEYVQLGVIIGVFLGGAIRIYLNISTSAKLEVHRSNSEQTRKTDPFFWSTAFGITSVYLSMFALVIWELPFELSFALLMGTLLAGTLTGLAISPLLLNRPKMGKSLEVGMGIILLLGSGLISIWKLIWPLFS
jgi:hypothetical protein